MSRGGVGTQGVGGGVRARRGAAQSTYMRRGRPD